VQTAAVTKAAALAPTTLLPRRVSLMSHESQHSVTRKGSRSGGVYFVYRGTLDVLEGGSKASRLLGLVDDPARSGSPSAGANASPAAGRPSRASIRRTSVAAMGHLLEQRAPQGL
jgi:hypothetical protein